MKILDKVILGINDTHDASAAIVTGGKILCAVAEERIQRVKSAGGYPRGAIDACLRQAGLRFSDIDYVAVAGTRAVPVNLLGTLSTFDIHDFLRIQEKKRYPEFYEHRFVPLSHLFPNYRPKSDVGYPLDKIPLRETREMEEGERLKIADIRLDFIAKNCGIARDRVFTFDHHTCHAYYAYYANPHREVRVAALTMDNGGDGVYDSVNVFDERGRMVRLHASHNCVIGGIYTYVTLLLGMRPYEHEYKVMGLAPYAKDYVKRRSREQLMKFLELEGVVFRRNPEMKDIFFSLRDALKGERFDGIAGGLQDFTEYFITRWVQAAMEKAGSQKVVFSGGVALNVKANKLISELSEIESLFVPPGAGDESLSIGAAWALMDHLGEDGTHRSSIEPLRTAYLGPDFSAAESTAFAAHPAVRGRYEQILGETDLLICGALMRDEIVAVCRGAMEFGPRALGHRSILANAGSRNAVDRINNAVKGRDFWMPFAPSILAEQCDEYLLHSGKGDLRFMTVCVDSTPAAQKAIPAGLHPFDHTVRVQCVTKEAAPDYHALLTRFRNMSGVGGVLNTSLNIHGKPIVMTPTHIADELLGEQHVQIECLAIGDRFFRKLK